MSIWLHTLRLRKQVGNKGKHLGELIRCRYDISSQGAEGPQANASTLKFPSDQDLNRKDKVSYEAMDLMNSLLQEKEHRLCSKKYNLNDCQYLKCVPGSFAAELANTQAWDYRAHHVYPDDAIDIKNHLFFHGLAWDRLHLSRPPFIPDIKGGDDTKYFDEDPISDVDDASSCCSGHEEPNPLLIQGHIKSKSMSHEDPVEKSPNILRNKANRTPAGNVPKYSVNGTDDLGKRPKKGREKKRPRDRVLRDKDVGRKVLELRKKGAFLGYTYRRHTGLPYDEERGRQSSLLKN